MLGVQALSIKGAFILSEDIKSEIYTRLVSLCGAGGDADTVDGWWWVNNGLSHGFELE